MKKIICLALLTGLFLFANSCHDEVAKESDSQLKSADVKNKELIDEVKFWFENNPKQNKYKILELSQKLVWDKAVISELDSVTYIELPIKLMPQYRGGIMGEEKLNTDQRLLFSKKKNSISSLIEFIVSYKDLDFIQNLEKVSHTKKDNDFEGTIVILDDNENIISVENILKKTKSAKINLEIATYYCYGLFSVGGDGSLTLIHNYWCYLKAEDSQSLSGSGGSGGSTGGTTTDPNTTATPLIIDDKLKDYPCAKNILMALSEGTSVDLTNFKINPTLTASILQLFKMSSSVNLYFDVQDLGNSDINGNTRRVAGVKDYIITLNSSYLSSATDLSIARTIIHEIIHAHLLYQVMEKSGDDFDKLAAIWGSMNGNPDQSKEYQHEFMVGIRNTIAANLFEWCRQSVTPVTLDYCNDLAWGGLSKTTTFQEILTSKDRMIISTELLNEKLNNSDAKGSDCH